MSLVIPYTPSVSLPRLQPVESWSNYLYLLDNVTVACTFIQCL